MSDTTVPEAPVENDAPVSDTTDSQESMSAAEIDGLLESVYGFKPRRYKDRTLTTGGQTALGSRRAMRPSALAQLVSPVRGVN
jgi:hypothetical protein